MADVVIVNAQTGEVTERDFTPEEAAQRAADEAAAAAAAAAAQAEADAKAAARASALAKLAALGLDEDEALALFGGQ